MGPPGGDFRGGCDADGQGALRRSMGRGQDAANDTLEATLYSQDGVIGTHGLEVRRHLDAPGVVALHSSRRGPPGKKTQGATASGRRPGNSFPGPG